RSFVLELHRTFTPNVSIQTSLHSPVCAVERFPVRRSGLSARVPCPVSPRDGFQQSGALGRIDVLHLQLDGPSLSQLRQQCFPIGQHRRGHLQHHRQRRPLDGSHLPRHGRHPV